MILAGILYQNIESSSHRVKMVQPLHKAFITGVVTIYVIYLVTLLAVEYQSFGKTLSVLRKTFDIQLRTNEKILKRFEWTFNVSNLSKEQEESIAKTIDDTRMEVVKMMLVVESRTKQKIAKTLKERPRINEMLQGIMVKKKHVLLDNFKLLNVSITYDLVLAVMSNTPHFDRREAIRASWSNKTKTISKNWCLFFVTGGVDNINVMRNLYVESQLKRDILIVDSFEDYDNNLPKKDMAAFTWAYSHLKFKHLLKCDDDLFIDIDALIALIDTKRSKKLLYMGNYWQSGANVSRKGKFAVSKEDYPNFAYPPYCSGGAYVLSKSLIGRIVPLFDWVSPLRIEDAYIGGMVKEAGGQGVHSNGFVMTNEGCAYRSGLVTSHPANVICMSKLMMESRKALQRTGE